MLIDSHCHLDYLAKDEAVAPLLARARSLGIGGFLTICTKVSEFRDIAAIAEAEPDVWCSVGIHPHEADAEPTMDAAKLVALGQGDKVIGIGETGLDYYYDHGTPEAQQRSFRAHIAASRQSGLPLIVHTRDADDDTATMMKEEYEKGAYPGVIHCFTASKNFAKIALGLGFYISLSGIVTFKSAGHLREVAMEMPLDRLLVETDAPYLAPVPQRGKRNEPAFVVHTAAEIARLRSMTAEALAEATTDNFFRLFRKAKRP